MNLKAVERRTEKLEEKFDVSPFKWETTKIAWECLTPEETSLIALMSLVESLL